MAITGIVPATVIYKDSHAWLTPGFLRPDDVSDFTFKDDGIDVAFHSRSFKRYWDFPCDPRNISDGVTYENGRFYIPTAVSSFTFDWITEPWTANLVGSAWQGGGDLRFMSTLYNGYLYNFWATEGTGDDALTSSDDWTVPILADWTALGDYLTAEYEYISASDVADGWGNHLKGIRVWPPDPHPRWSADDTHIPFDTFNFAVYGQGTRIAGGFFNMSARATFWIDRVSEVYVGDLYLTNNSGVFNSKVRITVESGLGIRFKRTATAEEIATLSDGDYAEKYVGNDGKQYYTVFFGVNGGEVWMAANLAETQFRNNTTIPFEGANTGYYTNEEWAALTAAARCAYNNDENMVIFTSTIAAISDGVTYDVVSELFTIPAGVTEFTFTKDGVNMILSEGEFYHYVVNP